MVGDGGVRGAAGSWRQLRLSGASTHPAQPDVLLVGRVAHGLLWEHQAVRHLCTGRAGRRQQARGARSGASWRRYQLCARLPPVAKPACLTRAPPPPFSPCPRKSSHTTRAVCGPAFTKCSAVCWCAGKLCSRRRSTRLAPGPGPTTCAAFGVDVARQRCQCGWRGGIAASGAQQRGGRNTRPTKHWPVPLTSSTSAQPLFRQTRFSGAAHSGISSLPASPRIQTRGTTAGTRARRCSRGACRPHDCVDRGSCEVVEKWQCARKMAVRGAVPGNARAWAPAHPMRAFAAALRSAARASPLRASPSESKALVHALHGQTPRSVLAQLLQKVLGGRLLWLGHQVHVRGQQLTAVELCTSTPPAPGKQGGGWAGALLPAAHPRRQRPTPSRIVPRCHSATRPACPYQ